MTARTATAVHGSYRENLVWPLFDSFFLRSSLAVVGDHRTTVTAWDGCYVTFRLALSG